MLSPFGWVVSLSDGQPDGDRVPTEVVVE